MSEVVGGHKLEVVERELGRIAAALERLVELAGPRPALGPGTEVVKQSYVKPPVVVQSDGPFFGDPIPPRSWRENLGLE